MAVNRDTSNGPDWKDVHLALCNAELFSNTKITLCIHNSGQSGTQYLVLEARAEGEDGPRPVAKRLVLVQSTMRQLNVKTLSAAFLNLLHQLDRKLYSESPWAGD